MSDYEDASDIIEPYIQRNKPVAPDFTAYAAKDFILAVQMGQVPGHKFLDKFGENPDIDTATVPEDIWYQGGLYPFDAWGTAPIISVVSDSPLDNQVIEIPGLDITGAEVTQRVQLNGTTRVALTTPLWRFNRAYNVSPRSNPINGNVYFYTGTGNVPLAAEIRGSIVDGNNQTLIAIYTIPKGKVGFLYRGEVGCSRDVVSGSVRAAYYSARRDGVFRIQKRVDIMSTGSSVYQDKRPGYDIIPALTDIALRVEHVSNNDTGVFGSLDILLVDETLFPESYLQAIRQPDHEPN